MSQFQQRLKKYNLIANSLLTLSNENLSALLKQATPQHLGIGGNSSKILIDNLPVFVKKVPLTAVETQPKHCMSTANVFNLPLFYQYGVGSAGFGAWRELAAHSMTTNWALTGECTQFPLLYHWRIIESDPHDFNLAYWQNLEDYHRYWEDSPAIRNRVTAISQAKTCIALFLEYVPQSLSQWLKGEILKGEDNALAAMTFAEKQLNITHQFINAKGLMHFDAHFENILTDGEILYLSDFGLALSSQFELSEEEKDFLKHHHNYDKCCVIVNLLHALMTALFGQEQWELKLKDYFEGKENKIPQKLAPFIQKYAPIALEMDAFFVKLQKESKLTPYPAERLEQWIQKI